MSLAKNMRLFLVFFIVNICLAAGLKCPTCFGNEIECELVEEISCSENTVKPISAFCPNFDDRAMWGLDFICLNVVGGKVSQHYQRFQGCFHRFNDQLDMCSTLKKACHDDMISCKNSTNGQVSDHWKSITEKGQPSAMDSNSPTETN